MYHQIDWAALKEELREIAVFFLNGEPPHVPAQVAEEFKASHPELMIQAWVYTETSHWRSFRIDVFEPSYVKSIEVTL